MRRAPSEASIRPGAAGEGEIATVSFHGSLPIAMDLGDPVSAKSELEFIAIVNNGESGYATKYDLIT